MKLRNASTHPLLVNAVNAAGVLAKTTVKAGASFETSDTEGARLLKLMKPGQLVTEGAKAAPVPAQDPVTPPADDMALDADEPAPQGRSGRQGRSPGKAGQ